MSHLIKHDNVTKPLCKQPISPGDTITPAVNQPMRVIDTRPGWVEVEYFDADLGTKILCWVPEAELRPARIN